MNSRVCAILLMLGTVGGVAKAATVRTVNLSEMSAVADRVFLGRCLAIEVAGTVVGMPVVAYTFQVLEGLRGVRAGDELTFRQVQTGRGVARGIPGMPAFKVGQELVILLHPDSRRGLTSPVGWTQGVFSVSRQPAGEVSLINALDNRNLALDLPETETRKMGLSATESSQLRQAGPVSFSVFRTVMEKFWTYQRQNPGARR